MNLEYRNAFGLQYETLVVDPVPRVKYRVREVAVPVIVALSLLVGGVGLAAVVWPYLSDAFTVTPPFDSPDPYAILMAVAGVIIYGTLGYLCFCLFWWRLQGTSYDRRNQEYHELVQPAILTKVAEMESRQFPLVFARPEDEEILIRFRRPSGKLSRWSSVSGSLVERAQSDGEQTLQFRKIEWDYPDLHSAVPGHPMHVQLEWGYAVTLNLRDPKDPATWPADGFAAQIPVESDA